MKVATFPLSLFMDKKGGKIQKYESCNVSAKFVMMKKAGKFKKYESCNVSAKFVMIKKAGKFKLM